MKKIGDNKHMPRKLQQLTEPDLAVVSDGNSHFY